LFGGLARNRTRTQGFAVSFEALFQPIDQAVAGTRNPPLAIRLDERAVKSAPAPATGSVRYGDDEVTDSAGCRSRLAYKRARPDLVESGMRHVSREALHWSSSVSLRRTPLPPAPQRSPRPRQSATSPKQKLDTAACIASGMMNRFIRGGSKRFARLNVRALRQVNDRRSPSRESVHGCSTS
jgi:hypothetical protein